MGRIGRYLKWAGLAALALCLAAVVYTGIGQMREDAVLTDGVLATRQPEDAIENFRTLRQQMRAMEKAQLNDVAHAEDSDAELKAMAQRALVDLCAREEQELTLEGVLTLRGFANPVVTVHENSVNVLICTEAITQQESALILELACRETGVQSGNIKIIPVN